MPPCVVEPLEVVNINQDERRAVAKKPIQLHRTLQVVFQCAAVVESREGVYMAFFPRLLQFLQELPHLALHLLEGLLMAAFAFFQHLGEGSKRLLENLHLCRGRFGNFLNLLTHGAVALAVFLQDARHPADELPCEVAQVVQALRHERLFRPAVFAYALWDPLHLPIPRLLRQLLETALNLAGALVGQVKRIASEAFQRCRERLCGRRIRLYLALTKPSPEPPSHMSRLSAQFA